MHLSVIIPAYNEERYLGETLKRIDDAAHRLQLAPGSHSVEVIVVDNESIDRTVELAVRHGCRVVKEREHNIGKVRNAGAREAAGDVLVFVDADTLVPVELFEVIVQRTEDDRCLGGASTCRINRRNA